MSSSIISGMPSDAIEVICDHLNHQELNLLMQTSRQMKGAGQPLLNQRKESVLIEKKNQVIITIMKDLLMIEVSQDNVATVRYPLFQKLASLHPQDQPAQAVTQPLTKLVPSEKLKFLQALAVESCFSRLTGDLVSAISNGWDVDARNQDLSRLETLAKGLHACATINKRYEFLQLNINFNTYGGRNILCTALHKFTQVSSRPNSGWDTEDTTVTGLLVEMGANPGGNAVDVEDQGTALTECLQFGRMKNAKLLLQKGASLEPVTDSIGSRPLHTAVVCGRKVLQAFLKYRPNPFFRNFMGNTPRESLLSSEVVQSELAAYENQYRGFVFTALSQNSSAGLCMPEELLRMIVSFTY